MKLTLIALSIAVAYGRFQPRPMGPASIYRDTEVLTHLRRAPRRG